LPHWFAPSAIFLLRQFYMGLPNDLMEAAKIDGAGHPRIFTQIMLPLTKSALVSQTVLTFVSVWNEYLTALIFLTKDKLTTVSLAVRYTMQADSQRTELAMASATSAIVPTLIIFTCCQSVFIEGIATSGVKG
jgi:multiple sugar transport system permease protein